MAEFGVRDMSSPLKQALMRRPGKSLMAADAAAWHYGAGFDAEKAIGQYSGFTSLIEQSGTEILWIEDKGDGLADAMFTQDPLLMTPQGAVLLRPGKDGRRKEVALHEAACKKAGIPILGRIDGFGAVEGGDTIWLDAETLLIGRGLRTNDEGIAQLATILAAQGVDVLSYDLPLWNGDDACFHLSSIVSPVRRDLALVYAPLLPVALYQILQEWGISLIEAPADEFHASNGASLQVLALKPGQIVMISGYPKTQAALEAAGCTVQTFDGDALCVACEGGPTGLICPLHRSAG
ncbi:N-dimethylarginine dimethylaminohydrolase [Rhizobium sp. PP-F2F-G48]|uniref:dimethylarginine dimethylaminohydrolase family protein n=1 Tax=Rhizobium sp. PP-F2F-G48 TaxID=2135651 RepID=UPI001047E143|nr:arginine deiminase family protein [Rhizobium sp. PP-F2F-G48]TCM56096.1 N-dimethylarginine dimethylaminohydrolase [Rhizobium sp. PP-F2F-G48]